MKLSFSSLAFFLLGAAVAAPSKLEQRVPSNAPINLDNGLEDGEIKECGGNFYDDNEVYLSIQYAVNLQKVGETRGSMLLPLASSSERGRERESLTDCVYEQKPNTPTLSTMMTAKATSWHSPITVPPTPTAWSTP